MKSNKNGLDEMQKEKRDNIGNQMFMLMFYMILVDCSLYGMGVRWAKYPLSTMVIIMGCMGIYLIRTIWANAYLPPKAQNRKGITSLALAIAFSAVLAAASFKLFKNFSAQFQVENDNSALILFIVSSTGLSISLIAVIIKKMNNSKGDE